MINQDDMLLPTSLENWQEKNIAAETFDGYKNKLKGRLYSLLCEREKDGEWEKFLDALVI